MSEFNILTETKQYLQSSGYITCMCISH